VGARGHLIGLVSTGRAPLGDGVRPVPLNPSLSAIPGGQ
jgi:hypothetical protein